MNREEFDNVVIKVIENIEDTVEKKVSAGLYISWLIFADELGDYLFSSSDEITIEPDKEV